VPAQAHRGVLAAGGDVAGGQGGDPGHVLAEQQDQAAGNPVGDLQVVVVEQPGRQFPATARAPATT